MGSKSVLANASDAAELLDAVLIETRFDHVPPKRALPTDEGSDSEEGGGGLTGKAATKEKVGDGCEEGDADHAAEEPVRPLPEVDRLELGQGNVLVLAVKWKTDQRLHRAMPTTLKRRTASTRASRGTFQTRAPNPSNQAEGGLP